MRLCQGSWWDQAPLTACVFLAVVTQLKPNTVITPATADPAFLTALKSALLALAPNSSVASSISGATEPAQIKLEYRPGREYNPGNGRAALEQVIVLEGGMYAPQEEVQAETSEAGGRDAYLSLSAGRRRDRGRFQSDRDRRNGELRLESFINGLATSQLSVRSPFSIQQEVRRN